MNYTKKLIKNMLYAVGDGIRDGIRDYGYSYEQ